MSTVLSLSDTGVARGSGNDGLRLLLPESWADDPVRMKPIRVPTGAAYRGQSDEPILDNVKA